MILRTVKASIAGILFLGACGGSADPEADVQLDPDAVFKVFGGSEYRFSPMDETSDLAKSSLTKAVAQGRISGFSPGPKLWEDGGPNSGTTMIMTVTIDDGIGAAAEAKSANVLLTHTAGRTVKEFETAMPEDSKVLLYLTPAVDLPKGSPEGLMIPVSPQGFAIALGDPEVDGVAFPMWQRVVEDESLLEQAP